MKKISILLAIALIFSVLTFSGCESETANSDNRINDYISENRLDLRNLLEDASAERISVYLGNYTSIALVEYENDIAQIVEMLLNDIEIETNEAKIDSFKEYTEESYGLSFVSLRFEMPSDETVLIRMYDDDHLYLYVEGKEFVSNSKYSSDPNKIYEIVLKHRTVPKIDTSHLNIQLVLKNESVEKTDVIFNSQTVNMNIDYAKLFDAIEGAKLIYVAKYDFTDSSEAVFHSYEYVECNKQIEKSYSIQILYSDNSSLNFYWGENNRIYLVNNAGDVFVSENEYVLEDVMSTSS